MTSIPIIIAPTAAAIELEPWTWDPTHSQATGTPTHSTRLPMNMIATSRAALSKAGSRRRARSISGSRGPPDLRLKTSRKP